MTDLFSIQGKVALVTGGGSGIGWMIAEGYARAGARVYIASRKKEELEARISELGGVGDCTAIVADLSTEAGCNALGDEMESREDKLDILVNNAGLTRDGLSMRMRDADWEIVIKVNLEAAFRLSRAALRSMMRQRFGRIVGITSVVGVTGNAGQANYAASKAGLIGMSKALAQEVAKRGVTVNCVAPGFIQSAMTDALNDKQREAILSTIPAERLGRGEEIAAAVIYLASEEAAYVTGQTLHVNGGMAMI